MIRKILIVSMFVSIAVIGCKKSNVNSIVGDYKIDTSAMLTAHAKRMSSVAAKEKSRAARALRAIKALSGSLRVNKDGKFVMTIEMKFLGKSKKRIHNGTWKQDGEKYILTGKNNAGKERTMPCSLSGKTLRCETTRKGAMFFTKQ